MKHETHKAGLLARTQANFLAGLAIVFPAVLSIAVLVWLFGTVSNITNTLLIFLPKTWTHSNGGKGDMYWYWSLFALLLAIAIICVVGRLARNYFGRKIIQLVDYWMLRIPLLNKIYGTVKQVNEAFSSGSKSSFKQVVMLEFPRPGVYSIGFVTGDQNNEVQAKTRGRVLSVFIPTTPNPTTGYLVLVPEPELTMLNMSVAEGIKYIVSLGSLAPEYRPGIIEPKTTDKATLPL